MIYHGHALVGCETVNMDVGDVSKIVREFTRYSFSVFWNMVT